MTNSFFFKCLAGMLIFGPESPLLHDLSLYINPFFFKRLKKQESIEFVQEDCLNEFIRRVFVRRIIFDNGMVLKTSNGTSAKFAQVITYEFEKEKIQISDALFNTRDFEYNERRFNYTLLSRVDLLSTLVGIIQYGLLEDVPILVEDFPNIAMAFFSRPQILNKDL